MLEKCEICSKNQPWYVLRFQVGDGLWYELDVCLDCKIVLDKYGHTYTVEDSI